MKEKPLDWENMKLTMRRMIMTTIKDEIGLTTRCVGQNLKDEPKPTFTFNVG